MHLFCCGRDNMIVGLSQARIHTLLFAFAPLLFSFTLCQVARQAFRLSSSFKYLVVVVRHVSITILHPSLSSHSLGQRPNKPKGSMAAGLQVFGQPASTDVARVLTCLFEKKLEFELVRIDTFKTHHRLPEFIRLRVRTALASVFFSPFFSSLCLVSILK